LGRRLFPTDEPGATGLPALWIYPTTGQARDAQDCFLDEEFEVCNISDQQSWQSWSITKPLAQPGPERLGKVPNQHKFPFSLVCLSPVCLRSLHPKPCLLELKIVHLGFPMAQTYSGLPRTQRSQSQSGKEGRKALPQLLLVHIKHVLL
jgi:hypothetical protein